MKTKLLHILALCALGIGLSGCTVHSSGVSARVGGEIYASSGDYYGHHYHRAPVRERVVVVPQQRVVVAPRPVVVAPRTVVVHNKQNHHYGAPTKHNHAYAPRDTRKIAHKSNPPRAFGKSVDQRPMPNVPRHASNGAPYRR